MTIDTWQLLCDRIASMKKVAVSFSGGVDSTVVLASAVRMLPHDHVAMFIDIPMIPERQRRIAKDVAAELGANLVTVRLCWDRMPGVRENTEDRCYHCKRAIYSAVKEFASDGTVCVDGENSSDVAGERPGRRAAAELGIVSPLKDLGIRRDDVMMIFNGLRLRTDVQKETCIATRIPFGVPFGDDDMEHIEECENIIRDISGVRLIRMRMRDGRAELVTLPDEVRKLFLHIDELSSALHSKGVSYIKIDEKGYRE
ncbi:MAG: hypothetical protein LBI08_01615 [Methanomassiliicoccaceae archaeon]|jgi:uncharacterized protein|nr:hypothetical protein [Methanomassiliicoccaceae archaeon]